MSGLFYEVTRKLSNFDKNQEHFYNYTVNLLAERGVNLKDIADLVYFLQKDYKKYENITDETIYESINKVLQKREVQNAIMTGIELDKLAEQHKLPEPLQTIIDKDEPLYGVDEVITFSITNLYGSIGFTNYGYVDKLKPGILQWLNDRSTGYVNVFLDDLVGAIAAAAASRLAHVETRFEDGNTTYGQGETLPKLDAEAEAEGKRRRLVKGKQAETDTSVMYKNTRIYFDSKNVTEDEILHHMEKLHFPENHDPFVAYKFKNQIFVY